MLVYLTVSKSPIIFSYPCDSCRVGLANNSTPPHPPCSSVSHTLSMSKKFCSFFFNHADGHDDWMMQPSNDASAGITFTESESSSDSEPDYDMDDKVF